MTKERKLAIEMWLWIREHYAEWDAHFWESGDEEDLVFDLKYAFFDEVYPNTEIPKWRAMCWFCQYTQDADVTYPFDCVRCPLKSCSKTDSAYYVLNLHKYKGDVHVTEEVFRNCCSTILYKLGYKGEENG